MAQHAPRQLSLTLTSLGWLSLISLVVPPFLLGGNREWAWGIMVLLIGILSIGTGVALFTNRLEHRPLPRSLRLAVFCYAVFILWCILQTQLPGHTAIWAHASSILGIDLRPYLSLDRSASWDGISRYVMYGLAGYCFYQITQQLHRWWLADRVLVGFALFGMLGLIFYLFFPDSLFGISRTYHDDLTGTHLNRNTAAAFLGMGIILCTARLLDKLIHPRVDPLTLDIVLARLTGVAGRYALLLFFLLVCLGLTHSRAGVICTGVGVLVLLLAAWRLPAWRNVQWLVWLPIGVGGLFLLLGSVGLALRWETLAQDYALRLNLYHTTLSAIQERPITGYGLGTYAQVIEHFHDHRIGYATAKQFDHAHNTYLENILEVGIQGTLLLLFAIYCLNRQILRNLVVQGHPALSLAGVAICVQLGLHSLVDFPVEMPATALMLVGVLVMSQGEPRYTAAGRSPKATTPESAHHAF